MGRARPPLLRVRDRDCFHTFFPAGSKRKNCTSTTTRTNTNSNT